MSEIKSYSMPLGPVHVALEEPVYFNLTVEGEIVRKVHLTSGHVHRGMEALAMQRNLYQNAVLVERVCSLCSNSHSFTYTTVVENALGIAIPERSKYLRVMAEEIKRVASHLFNLAIQAHLVGFGSLFMHVMEVREIMQDVKETLYGNRMNIAANRIGGSKYDLPADKMAYLARQLDVIEPQIREIQHLFTTDPMVVKRTKGIGILPPKDAIALGVVGPVARGSGIAVDVRKDTPYAAYDKLDFDVITQDGCCAWSRSQVRLAECFESIKMLRQCMRDIPEGPIYTKPTKFTVGEAVAHTEAPRGEVFYYIRTNGTDTPERLKWRVPSYMNWEALGVMMRDCKVADVALITNSIDPCVSCTER